MLEQLRGKLKSEVANSRTVDEYNQFVHTQCITTQIEMEQRGIDDCAMIRIMFQTIMKKIRSNFFANPADPIPEIVYRIPTHDLDDDTYSICASRIFTFFEWYTIPVLRQLRNGAISLRINRATALKKLIF